MSFGHFQYNLIALIEFSNIFGRNRKLMPLVALIFYADFLLQCASVFEFDFENMPKM